MILIERVLIVGSGSLLNKCRDIINDAYNNLPVDILNVTDLGNEDDKSQMKIAVQGKYLNGLGTNSISVSEKKEFLNHVLDNVKENTLILSVMNPYIISEKIVKKKNLLILNIHRSLLPRHRGLNPVAWTIWDGDEFGGITWHLINISVDQGIILVQKKIRIDEDMTSVKLAARCKPLILEALHEILPLDDRFLQEQIIETSEPVHGLHEKPNNGIFDINWNFDVASRFLRSMNFGILESMGLPIIIVECTKYNIIRYKIEGDYHCINNKMTDYDVDKKKQYIKVIYLYGSITCDISEIL